jgi:hypothetical protein
MFPSNVRVARNLIPQKNCPAVRNVVHLYVIHVVVSKSKLRTRK